MHALEHVKLARVAVVEALGLEIEVELGECLSELVSVGTAEAVHRKARSVGRLVEDFLDSRLVAVKVASMGAVISRGSDYAREHRLGEVGFGGLALVVGDERELVVEGAMGAIHHGELDGRWRALANRAGDLGLKGELRVHPFRRDECGDHLRRGLGGEGDRVLDLSRDTVDEVRGGQVVEDLTPWGRVVLEVVPDN